MRLDQPFKEDDTSKTMPHEKVAAFDRLQPARSWLMV